MGRLRRSQRRPPASTAIATSSAPSTTTFREQPRSAAATLLSAINVTGIPLTDQRVAIVGFGTAGIGIANLLVSVMQDHGLSADEARERFYPLDLHGLVVEGGEGLRPEQKPFARTPTGSPETDRSM